MRSPIIYIVAMAVGACTVLLHIQSYWWSESVTLCDVCWTADEGLVSLQLPLTRIAAKEIPTSEFLIYERGPMIWTSGLAGKTPLRRVMAMLDIIRADGAMFADFGFWKGSWQSNSRPGPFVVLFVPVWLGGVAVFCGYLAFHCRIIRFRVSSLLVAMTLIAGLLRLLTMRAAI